jgi:hypothetical protein
LPAAREKAIIGSKAMREISLERNSCCRRFWSSTRTVRKGRGSETSTISEGRKARILNNLK